MGEYNKYNVNELLEITTADDDESMRSIATGWVNTGLVLNTAKEALAERLEQMRKVWTAPSFAAFESFIHKTIAQVEAAQTQADNRSDAAGKIASTAGWAKERVKEQHDEYLKKKGESSDDITSIPLISGIPGFVPGPVIVPIPGSSSPTDEEIRRPYDKQARKIMKVALEEYEQQKPAMTQEVVPFKPIGKPGTQRGPGWFAPGEDDWGSDGFSGSNATDTAGFSSMSYGGNALASQSPSLQSGGPTHVVPTPNGGPPTSPTGGGPTFSGPSVGGMPPGAVNKTPAAPPKLPSAGTGSRNYLSPRSTGPASKTPGLPTQRNGMSRTGTSPNGRSIGNNGGKAINRTGRGLQKSQMAPKDLTNRVRASGDVIGRRAANTKQNASSSKSSPAPRRVQPSVVRGAKGIAKSAAREAPVDNTKRGYSSRVINPRNRLSEAAGHSRTPYVAKKLNNEVKPEPFGKRQKPETGRSRARREIEATREKRRQKLERDGLSRPVIDNGLTNTSDIHDVTPTPREAVKTDEPLWQPQKAVLNPVFGQQRWNPDAIAHDPGPQAFDPRQAFFDDLDTRLSKSKDPGPTAFDTKRQPVDPWPRE